MEVKNLPENVLRNIIEFKLGEPEYIKLKHSKGLREIQNKYRIEKDYNGYWIERKKDKTTFTLHIMRKAPFPLRNFEHFIEKQYCILYNFLQTNNEKFSYRPFIQLTGILVNDVGDGIGQYLTDDIETGFRIEEVSHSLYKSAIELMELFDEYDLYDDYDDYEDIGIQAFKINLILM